MKKSICKVTSLCLCIAVTCCTGIIFSVNGQQNDQTTDNTSKSISDDFSDIINTSEADKNETVYVIANADGSVKKIIVSDWIKNADKAANVTDKSDLTDITNTKDDFGYTMNDNNMRIWDAEGKDVYYSGTTDKALPVDVCVSYKLDGKSILADDIAGKSGKVTISFSYNNNEKKTVSIDGKNTDIYVPFAMLSGMILDNDKFSNVSVSNGKLINDGDKSIVVGFALPGLQENLGISEDKFKIPSTVEVTADVTDFELITTITLATNDIFNHINTDNLSSADDLTDSITQMSDASKKLVDGSDVLYDGLVTLLSKSNELIAGVDTLAEGAKTLSDGTQQLFDGSTELKNNMYSLSDGMAKLDGNSDSLKAGAKQVFETLLATADTQLASSGLTLPNLTIDNYKTVLEAAAASLDKDKVEKIAYDTALEQVTAQVNANESIIRVQVESGVKDVVYSKVLESQGMTVAGYEAGVAAGAVSAETQQQVNAAVDAQMNSEEVTAQIDAMTEQQKTSKIASSMQSEEVTSKIATGVATAEAGQKSIVALIGQLDSYNEFYSGILAYTAGVGSAADGSKQLYDGTSLLSDKLSDANDGAKDLLNGILQLKDGSAALVDGVSQLEEGSMQLSDGMKQFDDEAVQKLVDLANGDLKTISARIRATIDVSKDYQSFSGISDDMSGSVKFIYRTDSIEK